MYSVVIFLLITFSNVDSARNCTYISCIADFFQAFFSNEDTILNPNHGEVKEIKVGELQNIFSDLTELIERQKPKKSNGVLKDYGKTQVFVKYVTFDNTDSSKTESNDQVITVRNMKNNTVVKELKPNSSDASNKLDKALSTQSSNKTKMSIPQTSKPETDLDIEIISEQQKKSKEILEMIKLNSENFEQSLGDLRTNEIYEDIDFVYVDDYNSTDYPIVDYIDIYKDTTNEEIFFIPTEAAVSEVIQNEEVNFVEVKDFANETAALKEDVADEKDLLDIVPWIATIFMKNETQSSQFDYYCDGALLSKNTVLTTARCVKTANSTRKPEDVFVVVGKKGLGGTGPNEKAHRITKIIPHENFTDELKIENDLGILVLEDSVEFNDDVQPANVSRDMDFDASFEKSATTAWAFTGDLAFVFFDKVQNKTCPQEDYVENTICATYGNKVPLCPSYGGLFVVKLDQWYLQGIMYADPMEKGLCFSKDVTYTSLKNYLEWIDDINKNF